MRFSERVTLFQMVLGLLMILSWTIVQSADLGTIGPTYPIGEDNALDLIMKKLRQKEQSGELKRMQQEAIERSMHHIKNMKPVEGIVTTSTRAQRWIDPTVTYTQSVKTEEGRVVIPAGTKINPLDRISLTQVLVFFDGRDPAQRDAVGRLVARRGPLRVKPILVAGSWFDLTQAWKTQVFYDQQGRLSKRFGIRAVPSVIRQQGKKLLLDEIPAKALK